jgi:hypothetical protein
MNTDMLSFTSRFSLLVALALGPAGLAAAAEWP